MIVKVGDKITAAITHDAAEWTVKRIYTTPQDTYISLVDKDGYGTTVNLMTLRAAVRESDQTEVESIEL